MEAIEEPFVVEPMTECPGCHTTTPPVYLYVKGTYLLSELQHIDTYMNCTICGTPMKVSLGLK